MRLLQYATQHKIHMESNRGVCFLYPSFPNSFHHGIVSDIHATFGSNKCVWIHYALNVDDAVSSYRRHDPGRKPVVIVSIKPQFSRYLVDLVQQLFYYGASVVAIIPTHKQQAKSMIYLMPNPIAFFELRTGSDPIPWSNDEFIQLISESDTFLSMSAVNASRKMGTKAPTVIYDEFIKEDI